MLQSRPKANVEEPLIVDDDDDEDDPDRLQFHAEELVPWLGF